MAVKKGGLGRGLDSLFSENATDSDGAVKLNINDIEPNRDQPRKDFDEQSISELADSIARHGLIQPIVVKPNANGRYSIIAGERRWRASRIAGLNEVPVIIKDADEQTLMGKVPHGVLKRCKKANVPVWLLSGMIDDATGRLSESFDVVRSINEGDNRPLSVLMQPDVAKQNIKRKVRELL